MKKGILFALAALCVSAVQAVTLNWTATVRSDDTGEALYGNRRGRSSQYDRRECRNDQKHRHEKSRANGGNGIDRQTRGD